MTKPLLASADLPVLGREGDAQAAPSGERTMAAGHITARLRVVSKCVPSLLVDHRLLAVFYFATNEPPVDVM